MNKQSALAAIGLILFACGVGLVFWFTYRGGMVVQQRAPIVEKAPAGTGHDDLADLPANVNGNIRQVMVTNGVKHSVPLNEIISGGPAKDGIPSIDHPKFLSIEDAETFLADDEPGIAVSLDGIDRFYPFQILLWHEIVNDDFNGRRVLVTYCPLCRSGIVFDPTVFTERVEFGTSGKLWNSNLVMYDRKTDSLWPQVLGEAVVGEATGQMLPVLPSDQVLFGDWKAAHPDGEVLSRNTGVNREYGYDPYGEDYYTTPGIYFPVNVEDDRLDQKALVFGIVVDDQAKAYDLASVREAGEVEDAFAGKTFVLRYEPEIEAVRMYEKKFTEGNEEEETLERVNPFTTFWFAWAAAHPDTALFFTPSL